MSNLKKEKNDCKELTKNSEERRKQENGSVEIGAGYAATRAAQTMTQQAARKYAKPETYTGNRTTFDSSAAKLNAKKSAFSGGEKVIDPYTGDELVLTIKEAKKLYGADWQKHLAESDHVKPLEQIYNDTKGKPWLTENDIKDAANSKENIEITSRKFNNAKRSRTNKELVNDKEYLKKKDVELTKEGARKAIKHGEVAERSINKQLAKSTIKNVVNTGHEAGKFGAENAGITTLTVSGIMNVVSVIKGEKNAEEAIADIVKDSGKAAVSGYGMGAGLTVLSHSLSNSSSKFIQGLVKSNVPGKVITAVVTTGDTLKKWGEGEITTQECLIELGDKGLNMVTMGYSMAVGQALIPIPIVGGAVGALVGSMLTSGLYNHLINILQTNQLEHEERMRIIEECHLVEEQARTFRAELEKYLDSYFKEYRECFETALSSMQLAYQMGDADGIIAGANDITRKLGGKVYYETIEEFKEFIDEDSTDVL